MIDSIIAYNIAEVEKKKVLSEAKDLYKSKLITEEQWNKIKNEYVIKLNTPPLFMRVLFFVFSLLGLMTLSGPFVPLFESLGEAGYQILALILGAGILFATEKLLINDLHHYKSGAVEAGIYSSLSFLAFAVIGTHPPSLLFCTFLGFLLTAAAAIRYLDVLSMVAALGFFGWILFQMITNMGGTVEALMPFIFMAVSGSLYWTIRKIEAKGVSVIFNNHLFIAKTITLLFFYVSGNYYVVRELSISLMGLQLGPQDDIPYAILFYLLTALIPAGFLLWGIRQKSTLWIRMGMLTLALSVITFKYYFPWTFPVLTVTILGAILIVAALLIFNYLKQVRHGFTREELLKDKWQSPDLMALIASQTLGGQQMDVPAEEEFNFKGGSFGGAGAGETW